MPRPKPQSVVATADTFHRGSTCKWEYSKYLNRQADVAFSLTWHFQPAEYIRLVGLHIPIMPASANIILWCHHCVREASHSWDHSLLLSSTPCISTTRYWTPSTFWYAGFSGACGISAMKAEAEQGSAQLAHGSSSFTVTQAGLTDTLLISALPAPWQLSAELPQFLYP